MRRSSPAAIVVLFGAGAILGWFVEFLLAQNGRALVTPPVPFSVVLLVIAAGVIVAAVPVRRVARGKPGATVNPFLAARVVVFAQAAALTAAILLGLLLGALLFVLTRPVVGAELLWPSVLGAAAAAVLLAAALVAEEMCRIPPGEDGPQEDLDG